MIDIHIGYKDRPTELALLLESLMFQTYQDFDIYISDDCSGTTMDRYYFIIKLINKLKETHKVIVTRNQFNLGVSKNRQKLIDMSKETDSEFVLRLDDDVIIEKDYIEKLVNSIGDYDLISGVTPPIESNLVRETKFIKPVVNATILKDGKAIYEGDDCGVLYDKEEVIPCHHFRSCALIRKKVFDKVSYDSKLSKHGFREETILSYKMIMAGFKLAVNTSAIAWHLLTPSGGERFEDSENLIKFNTQMLDEFIENKFKEHGNFIEDYNKKLNLEVIKSKEDFIKDNNLRRYNV